MAVKMEAVPYDLQHFVVFGEDTPKFVEHFKALGGTFSRMYNYNGSGISPPDPRPGWKFPMSAAGAVQFFGVDMTKLRIVNSVSSEVKAPAPVCVAPTVPTPSSWKERHEALMETLPQLGSKATFEEVFDRIDKEYQATEEESANAHPRLFLQMLEELDDSSSIITKEVVKTVWEALDDKGKHKIIKKLNKGDSWY